MLHSSKSSSPGVSSSQESPEFSSKYLTESWRIELKTGDRKTWKAPDELCPKPKDPWLLELLLLGAMPTPQTVVLWIFLELGVSSLYLGLLAPNPTARKDAPILAASPHARTMTPHAIVIGSREVTSI